MNAVGKNELGCYVDHLFDARFWLFWPPWAWRPWFTRGAVRSEIKPFRGYTLVGRYDRQRNETGKVERLHQEDFCQALGLPAGRKNENEGGPGLVVRLLEEMTLRLGTALAEWTVSFTSTVGKDPVIDRVRSHVRSQVRRTRNLMALV